MWSRDISAMATLFNFQMDFMPSLKNNIKRVRAHNTLQLRLSVIQTLWIFCANTLFLRQQPKDVNCCTKRPNKNYVLPLSNYNAYSLAVHLPTQNEEKKKAVFSLHDYKNEIYAPNHSCDTCFICGLRFKINKRKNRSLSHTTHHYSKTVFFWRGPCWPFKKI